MRPLLACFLTLVILPALHTSASPLAYKSQQVAASDITKSVVFFRVPKKVQNAAGVQGDALEIGTGFIANLNGILFIITASHVARQMNAASLITISGESDGAATFPMSDFISSNEQPSWVYHPIADVGVLRLKPSPAVSNQLTGRGLPPAVFISSLEAPSRSRPLTVVGFPLGLGVISTGPDARLSAITKESKAASGLLTLRRADNQQATEFFLLDSPSVGGFSGAPVMILPTAFSEGDALKFSNATFCVGLVHGTLSDETGGKFAAIVPSAFITQTLEAAYLRETQRK